MRKLVNLPEDKILEHLKWAAERWISLPGKVYQDDLDRRVEGFLTPLCENEKQLENYLRFYESFKIA